MQTTILLPTDYTILQLKMALINICVQATNPIVKLRCRTYIYIYVICRSAQPFNLFFVLSKAYVYDTHAVKISCVLLFNTLSLKRFVQL